MKPSERIKSKLCVNPSDDIFRLGDLIWSVISYLDEEWELRKEQFKPNKESELIK